jgi:4-hydroxy-3-methylbut-2-enyl diphosphate reductase
MSLQKILMVKPRGFCAGVVRAVDIVEEALQITQPVYVRKEIVHNKFVVEGRKPGRAAARAGKAFVHY